MSVQRDLVTVAGLSFNDPATWYRQIDVMEGWEDSPPLSFVVVPNGGGPGGLLGAPTIPTERPLTVGGAWATDSIDNAELARRQLLALFPRDVEVAITRRGRTMFCVLADKVEVDLGTPRGFRFTVPLMALDPLRYDPTAISGSVGVFTSDAIWRTYDATGFYRTYDAAGFYRTYASAGSSASLVLVNTGDTDSRRVVIDVTGPLTAGDWRIVNETTGQEMRGALDLAAGQVMSFNTKTTQATIGGNDATVFAYGDWITLAPGPNTLRLVSSTVNALASMTVTAYSASR